MKKIAVLKIEQFMGVEEALIEPEKITIIKGENGKGKSSRLDAIIATLDPKGVNRAFVKSGANEARTVIKFEDGETVTRKYKGNRSEVVVRDSGNNIKPAPQTYLDSLIGSGINFNPVEFLSLKPSQQREMLLQALPITVTDGDLIEWFQKPFDVDTTKHGLEVLSEVEKKLYDERATANAEVKALQGNVATLEQQVPIEFNPKDWENVDTSSLTQELQDIGKKEEEKRNCFKESERYSYDALQASIKVTHYATKIEETDKYIERLQAEKKELERNKAALEEEKNRLTDAADQMKYEAEQYEVPDKTGVEKRLSEYSQAQAQLKLLDQLNFFRLSLEEKENIAVELHQMVELSRSKPAELLAKCNFPIAGLELADGEIKFNGLPISSLSDSEKLRLSLEIARALSGELGFILVNGIERLDPKNMLEFFENIKDDPYNYFIEWASLGDIEVITDVDSVIEEVKEDIKRKSTQLSMEEE